MRRQLLRGVFQRLFDVLRVWLRATGHQAISRETLGRRLRDLGLPPRASTLGAICPVRIVAYPPGWAEWGV